MSSVVVFLFLVLVIGWGVEIVDLVSIELGSFKGGKIKKKKVNNGDNFYFL